MNNTIDPLLAEIEAAIKQEKLNKFFAKYGTYFAIIAIVLILGLGGFKIYESQTNASNQKAGNLMFEALGSQDTKVAIEKLDEAAKNSNYTQIAKLSKAQLLAGEGKTDEAYSILNEVAKGKGDKALTNLAALNAANMLLNKDPKNKDIEQILLPITADKGAFRYNAMELLAVYYTENGQADKAAPLLKTLTTDTNVPFSISFRAKEVLSR